MMDITTGVESDRLLVAIWITPAIITVLALLVCRLGRLKTQQTVQRAATFLIVAYALGVVVITLYPYSFDFEPGRIFDRGNWTPFGGTLGFLISENSLRVRIASRDFLANIALFTPLGVLLGSRSRRLRDLLLVVALLVCMAFSLEVVQGLTVAERTLDIDDAIAGSIGALGAAVLGAALLLGATSRTSRYA